MGEKCPYCEEELTHSDVFGYLCAHQSGEVLGDIYKCGNDDCEANGEHFYTHRNDDGELHEGYPC